MDKRIREPDFQKEMFKQGDPDADHIIGTIADKHGLDQVNNILTGLIRNEDVTGLLHGDKLSPSLVDTQYRNDNERSRCAKHVGQLLSTYLTESARLPKEPDADMLQISEAVFAQHSMIAFSILGCASLPEAYATTYASRVLAMTQQLETHIHRRLGETTLFVTQVMSPGGLKPDGPGIRSAQKVRLMHAAIRRLILQPPDDSASDNAPSDLGHAFLRMTWPKEEVGLPIHQISMSMAILSFSYIILRSLGRLGIDLSPVEQWAYLHRWNIIAEVMGVTKELRLSAPETMDEAEEMYSAIWRPAMAETPQGRALENTLLEYLESFIPKTLGPLNRIPRILTRELIGPKIARMLDIRLDFTDNLGLQAMKAMTGLNRYAKNLANVLGVNVDWAGDAGLELMKGAGGLDHLDTNSIDEFPPVRLAAEWLFRRMAKQLNTMQRGGKREPFKIPDSLTQRK
jgi:hypothetical protein